MVALFLMEKTLDTFQNYIGYSVEQEDFNKSRQTAIFVGTILAFINRGNLIMSGVLIPEWIMKIA